MGQISPNPIIGNAIGIKLETENRFLKPNLGICSHLLLKSMVLEGS